MKNNKDIVLHAMERLWNKRDLSTIDSFFAENAVIHSPMRTLMGKGTMKDVVEKWLSAFPDMAVRWDECIAQDNKIALRFLAEATHLGGFFETKPTHREVRFSGVIIFHLQNEKVVDYWSLVDIHAILSQLEEYETMNEALES